MRHEPDAFWDGFVRTTALLGLVAGLAVFAASFLLMWAGALIAERAGWLPESWGRGHTEELLLASALVAAPAAVAGFVWLFRRMTAGERAFIRAEREY